MKRDDILRGAALTALILFVGCNEIAGIKAGDPIGSPIDCVKDSDCPAASEPECSSFVACKASKCAYASELDGKVTMAQTTGDCSQRVCDGKGGVRLQAYDADVEDDGLPCTLDVCEGGLSKHTPQQDVPCYSGAVGTVGVGLCKAGIQHCDASFQPVGGCEGEIAPQAESCLTPGDEDCDGQVNEEGEGCVCTPSTVSSCYDGPQGTSGVGPCKVGTCLCNGAGTACASACTEVVPLAKEDCSTPIDDDCDGKTVDVEDGCVCVANQMGSCYTGPPGTQGVGTCASGMGMCDTTGKGYLGACSDILPHPADDCTVVGDDDCDGTSVDTCTGSVDWVKASTTTGQTYDTSATSIASDAAGDLFAAGTVYCFSNEIDVGGGPLSTPNQGGGDAAFVVKLAPDGTHLWSKILPCANVASPYTSPHLAVAGGQVVIAYSVQNSNCSFNGGAPAPTSGVAIIRRDAGTGAFVSSSVIGSDQTKLFALAAGSSGVYLAGYQNTSGTFGAVQVTKQPFVVKVDGNNAVLWAKGFVLSSAANGESNRVSALAVLPDDAVAFAGNAVSTTIDLGAGVLGQASSPENHYFGVLEPAGTLRWGKVFSSSPSFKASGPSALAVARSGNLIALGSTANGLQLGSVAVQQGYVGSLSAATGAVDWAKQMKPGGVSLSVDVLGHLGIGYQYSIVMLGAAGAPLWTKDVPVTDSVLLAPAKDAGLLFTSTIQGAQSFDGKMVGINNGHVEIVFGKLAP